jgi:hypothetical protein
MYSLQQFLGQRGQDSQSTIHGYDAKTGVIFFSSFHKNGISCWNPNNILKPDFVEMVYQNNSTLIYPCDLKVGEKF